MGAVNDQQLEDWGRDTRRYRHWFVLLLTVGLVICRFIGLLTFCRLNYVCFVGVLLSFCRFAGLLMCCLIVVLSVIDLSLTRCMLFVVCVGQFFRILLSVIQCVIL